MANRFLSNLRINDAYTFPDNDGSVGQAIVTDGAGNLTFGSAVASSADDSESVHIPVKNTSGVSISKGTPVYITGETGNSGKIEIAAADAVNANKMPALGLLESTLSNNSEGFCVQGGLLENIATATIDGQTPTANQTVYVKSGGGLTLTKPTGTALIQNIAKVARVHASQGSLVVSAILRANDIPNLPEGKIWVGDDNTTVSTIVHLDELNGRVGIGTSSPEQKLDVRGDVQIHSGASATSVQELGFKNIYNTALLKASYTNPSQTTETYLAFHANTSGANNGTVAEQMRIAGNKVGIGTTDPAYHLVVKDATNNSWLQVLTSGTDKNTGTVYTNDAGSWTVGIRGADSDKFYIGNQIGLSSGKFVIDTSGNVGIGTTSPIAKLHLVSDDTTASAIKTLVLGGGTSVDGNGQYIQFSSSSNDALGSQIAGTRVGAGASSDLRFSTTSSTSVVTERMRIDSSGNVGIGTDSPLRDLHVKKDISGGQVRAEIFNISNTANSHGILSIYSGGSSAGDAFLHWKINGVQDWSIGIDNSDSDKLKISKNFGPGTNDYLTIDTSGNVGIGTTSPTNGKLQLFNSENINGIFIENSSASFTNSGLFVNNTSTTNGNLLRLRSSGSDKLVVLGNGNVGIGTDSPSKKLHINSGNTNDVALFESTDSFANIYIKDNSGEMSIQKVGTDVLISAETSTTHGNLRFLSNTGTERMRISSSGLVGIGTMSPARELEVQGGGNVYIRVVASTDNDSSAIELQNTQQTWTIRNDDTNDDAFEIDSSTTGNIITIEKTGNVGIGTTSPEYKLDVSGSSAAGFRLTTNGFTGLDLVSPRTSGNLGGLRFKQDIDAHQTSEFLGLHGGGFDWKTGDGSVAPSIKMSMLANGNVGIGTTNPIGKLYVGPTWDSSYGGNDLYIKSGNALHSYDPRVIATSDLGITYTTTSTNTSGPDKVGLTLFNNDNTAGTFSPMLLFAKREVVSSSYKATMAGIYARSPLGTGNSGSWIDGELIFATAGAASQGIKQRMVIDKEGNVGIGTTNPAVKLDTNGVISSRLGSESAYSVGVLEITSNGTPTQIKITTNIPYTGTSNAHSVTIRGFNYSNAQTVDLQISWHVYNSSFYNRTATSTGSWTPTVRLAVENNKVVIHLSNPGPGYWPKMYVESLYNAYGGPSHAQGWSWADSIINSDANTPNEVVPYKVNFGNSFAMNSSGNVGIGTTSPSTELHVKGSAEIFRIDDSSSTGSPFMTFFQNGTRRSLIQHLDSGDMLSLVSEYGGVRFMTGTGGTEVERMRIDSSGNVGIGTTSPSVPLEVNGLTRITRLGQATTYQQIEITDVQTTFNGQDPDGYMHYAFKSNDSTKLFINGSSGNVGIGTTSPAKQLHLAESATLRFTRSTSNTTGFDIGLLGGSSDASAYIFNRHSGTNIVFGTSNAERMRITSSGNVGIGTTSPSAKLDIGGGDGTPAGTQFAAVIKGTGTRTLYLDSDGTTSSMWWGAGNTPHFAIDSQNGGGAAFWTYSGGWARRMDITSAGNVGIGTTSPSEKLHVVSTRADVFAESTSATQATRFRLKTTTREWRIGTNSPQGDGLWFYDADAASYRMIINSSGNVGIGTTSPTQKLHVNGDARLGRTSISTTSTSSELTVYLSGGGSPIEMNTASGTGAYLRAKDGSSGSQYWQWGAYAGINYVRHFNGTSTFVRHKMASNHAVWDISGNNNSQAFSSRYTFRNRSSNVRNIVVAQNYYASQKFISFLNDTSGYEIGRIMFNGTSNVTYSTSGSDIRLKENIQNWDEDISSKITALQPKTFTFKHDLEEEQQKGFIAQNEADNFPEAYPKDPEGYHTWNPSGMVVYLMKALKEQIDKTTELESRIEQLEAKI